MYGGHPLCPALGPSVEDLLRFVGGLFSPLVSCQQLRWSEGKQWPLGFVWQPRSSQGASARFWPWKLPGGLSGSWRPRGGVPVWCHSLGREPRPEGPGRRRRTLRAGRGCCLSSTGAQAALPAAPGVPPNRRLLRNTRSLGSTFGTVDEAAVLRARLPTLRSLANSTYVRPRARPTRFAGSRRVPASGLLGAGEFSGRVDTLTKALTFTSYHPPSTVHPQAPRPLRAACSPRPSWVPVYLR